MFARGSTPQEQSTGLHISSSPWTMHLFRLVAGPWLCGEWDGPKKEQIDRGTNETVVNGGGQPGSTFVLSRILQRKTFNSTSHPVAFKE